DESFVWSSGDVRAAAHDGRTGAALDSRGVSLHAAPTVAGASLLTLFNGLRKERGQEASGYAEAKRLAARELKTTPERRREQLLDAFAARTLGKGGAGASSLA
ncbi:unnamed protein product, partial [Effrenium voratum]